MLSVVLAVAVLSIDGESDPRRAGVSSHLLSLRTTERATGHQARPRARDCVSKVAARQQVERLNGGLTGRSNKMLLRFETINVS